MSKVTFLVENVIEMYFACNVKQRTVQSPMLKTRHLCGSEIIGFIFPLVKSVSTLNMHHPKSPFPWLSTLCENARWMVPTLGSPQMGWKCKVCTPPSLLSVKTKLFQVECNISGAKGSIGMSKVTFLVENVIEMYFACNVKQHTVRSPILKTRHLCGSEIIVFIFPLVKSVSTMNMHHPKSPFPWLSTLCENAHWMVPTLGSPQMGWKCKLWSPPSFLSVPLPPPLLFILFSILYRNDHWTIPGHHRAILWGAGPSSTSLLHNVNIFEWSF